MFKVSNRTALTSTYISLTNVRIDNRLLVGSSFQGTVAGYVTNGGLSNRIDKFPFATDTNSTRLTGKTSLQISQAAGQSSTISGYTSGGISPNRNTIEKFSFSTDADTTDVGDLTAPRDSVAGHSSDVSGYTSGGNNPTTNYNVIDKFPFAANASATDVGDLSATKTITTGQSSTINGYVSGGFVLGPPNFGSNVIEKFPFAKDSNTTDVGDLSGIFGDNNLGAGISSADAGYRAGGFETNIIDKFPFATDSNSVNIGSLTQARNGAAGQSSTSHGYASGGIFPPNNLNTIDKFPFATDAGATDVGDISLARFGASGQQD